MRIENLEIKRSAVEIFELGYDYGGCDTCEEEGAEFSLEIKTETLHFHAAVGTICAEKYLRMLAE